MIDKDLNIKPLIVSPLRERISRLRLRLQKLGVTHVSTVKTHGAALDRATDSFFSHILFEAVATDITALEFVEGIVVINRPAKLIVLSEQPQIDDVFGLLKAGSHAFLIPPVSTDLLEQTLIQVSEGPPLTEALQNLSDSASFLSRVIMNNFSRLLAAKLSNKGRVTEAEILDEQIAALKGSVETGKMFCPGGIDHLIEQLADDFIEHAKRRSTRLRRLRYRLRKEREERNASFEPDSRSGDE